MNRYGVALAVVAGLASMSCSGDDATTEEGAPSTVETSDQEAGDTDGAVETGALSTVSLGASQLVIEIPVDTPEYRVTAEVPATWTSVVPADTDDAEVASEAWELVGAQVGGLTVEIYDSRGTGYEVETVAADGDEDVEGWDSLYRFTGETVGPPRGVIGGTEEVEIPEHRPGFDLLILDVDSDGASGMDEASKLVVSLDGSYFVTFTTPFGLDDVADAAMREAYTTILATARVLPA